MQTTSFNINKSNYSSGLQRMNLESVFGIISERTSMMCKQSKICACDSCSHPELPVRCEVFNCGGATDAKNLRV